MYVTWRGVCLSASIVIWCFRSVDASPGSLFSSSDAETLLTPVNIQGAIPHWLQGSYIRIGPGKFGMGQRNFTHAFDGFAKLYGFYFDAHSDKFRFSARFLETKSYKTSRKIDNVAPYLLFDRVQPPFSVYEYITSLFNGIDNTNVNIVQLKKDKFSVAHVALSDFWHFYEFNISNLFTVASHNPRHLLSHVKYTPIPSTAHPLREHGTENYISFFTEINPISSSDRGIHLMRIKSLYERELIASIKTTHVPYMHSFALTKKFAIIFAHPIHISLRTMLVRRSPLQSLEWNADRETDVYVVDIKHGHIKHLTCPAMFLMHVANAYETGSSIMMDASTYSSLLFLNSLRLDFLSSRHPRLPPHAFATMKRIVVDLSQDTVKIKDFHYQPGFDFTNRFDLPVINSLYSQRRHCYIYGLGIGADNGSFASSYIIKKDVCGQSSGDKLWKKKNRFPSEPWFEPRPGATQEDDGVVMSLVMDLDSNESYLLCLDGKTLVEKGRGVLPTTVPFTIHGRMFHTSQNFEIDKKWNKTKSEYNMD